MTTLLTADRITLLQLDLLVAVAAEVLCSWAYIHRDTHRGVMRLGALLLGRHISFALSHGKSYEIVLVGSQVMVFGSGDESCQIGR